MDKRENELLNKIDELEAVNLKQKREIDRLTSVIDEYKKKEQSISNAIIASMEHANQLETSRKKLYLLDIQRSRLLYLRMEQIINELYKRYPELTKDDHLRDMSEKFKSLVNNDINEKSKDTVLFDMKKQTTDDPIKKLLHNIIDRFDSKKPAEPQKPVAEEIKPSSSGFDLNEALHPTMGLDEIMKAFNLGNTNNEKPEDK